MATSEGTEQGDSTFGLWTRPFDRAKKSMQKIYENDMIFVQRMLDIVADNDFPGKGFTKCEMKLKDLIKKIESICVIIGRDKMKAVIFGMTSSGKSALINALLRDNVLPSLCGETTAAFITVEGTDSQTKHAKVENRDGSHKQISMEDVWKRSNVLESGVMSCDEITVYWPKGKCELLKNELVIIDCPGMCTTSATDTQVTKYCKDADIHIFVVSSISSLNEQACNFFEDVAKCISKPNVLIVFTFCDIALQMKPIYQEKVRGQHQERATKLLKDKLGVVETDEQVANRIFFFSPNEILEEDKVSLPKNWQERQTEFTRFEDTFKELVSTSAINTKFKGHYEEGKKIVDKATEHLEEMATVLQSSMNAKEDQLRELKTKIKTFSNNRESFAQKSQLFVDSSNKRIVKEQSEKVVGDATTCVKKDVKCDDVKAVDENESDKFKKNLTEIALKRTKEVEESFKLITERAQDKLKADVKDLFHESFPDITLTGIPEGGHKHVEINYSDADKESGRGVSAGFLNYYCGSTRKLLSSRPSVICAAGGTAWSGIQGAVGGGMWWVGALLAPAVAGAAVVIGGAVVCGYGIKQGLDWNRNRLDNKLREQCAGNTAKFMESKLGEFQEKYPDVMERYSSETIQPYLDRLNEIQRGLEQQERELNQEIVRMKKLLEKVTSISQLKLVSIADFYAAA
ncbi:transmembrane GTPase Marf-like isoform X2 [Asterias amurensis]|uniref:transmembrane GTPase Marf-like isoform X2 n=1 Tax=Asterias amurensis TaxID=7602 RepID=UPI003AB8B9E6